MTALLSTLVFLTLAALLGGGAHAPTSTTSTGNAPASTPTSPAPPPGESVLVITEEELNRAIAANAGSFGPARNVRAVIEASRIVVRFTVFGIGGTFSARPVAREGTIVLEDARVDGPLGLVVDADTLRDRLTSELQQRLAAEGVTVDGVWLEPGRLLVQARSAGRAPYRGIARALAG